MLRALKSSKFRERAQAAAQHVRGLSPKLKEIVSLHPGNHVLSWLNFTETSRARHRRCKANAVFSAVQPKRIT